MRIYIAPLIIGLIRQVGSNKRKIEIKYKIQNKQTTMKKTSMQSYTKLSVAPAASTHDQKPCFETGI